MTIKRLLTVALAAVFIAAIPGTAKNDSPIRKDRKSLEKENADLKARMDSLKQ